LPIRLRIPLVVAPAASPPQGHFAAAQPTPSSSRWYVIDLKNGRDGLLDVAIADGKIAEVAPSIDVPRRSASPMPRASSPGLIDMHAHVFHGTEPDAFERAGRRCADSHSFRSGQTTLGMGEPAGALSDSSRPTSSHLEDASLLHNIVDRGWAGRPRPRTWTPG
jgi:hypothetical protein